MKKEKWGKDKYTLVVTLKGGASKSYRGAYSWEAFSDGTLLIKATNSSQHSWAEFAAGSWRWVEAINTGIDDE